MNYILQHGRKAKQKFEVFEHDVNNQIWKDCQFPNEAEIVQALEHNEEGASFG